MVAAGRLRQPVARVGLHDPLGAAIGGRTDRPGHGRRGHVGPVRSPAGRRFAATHPAGVDPAHRPRRGLRADRARRRAPPRGRRARGAAARRRPADDARRHPGTADVDLQRGRSGPGRRGVPLGARDRAAARRGRGPPGVAGRDRQPRRPRERRPLPGSPPGARCHGRAAACGRPRRHAHRPTRGHPRRRRLAAAVADRRPGLAADLRRDRRAVRARRPRRPGHRCRSQPPLRPPRPRVARARRTARRGRGRLEHVPARGGAHGGR